MNNEPKSLKDSNEEREEIQFYLQHAKEDLLTFAQLVYPKYESTWFHEIIASKLEQTLTNLRNKKKTRIILAIPPRSGKSLLASQLFPSWVLGNEPNAKIILSTYGAELSEKMGLATRDIISSEHYQHIFPGIHLRPDVKAKAKWMTNKQGSYTAVGIGSAVTGIGADIIILDDPHKSREEAESQNIRDTIWEYYRSTLYSRLEGFGAVIVIMQRWHADDMVGRLLEYEKEKAAAGEPHDSWEVVNFPAIASRDEYHPDIPTKLLRKEGDALWPSKFPLPVLENIKATQGYYNWASQYCQDPILSELQEFKQETFRYFEEEDLQTRNLRYYTLVDPAISQKKEADNTVVLTIAKEVSGPNIYRIREDATHLTPTQTIELIFKHHALYRSEVFLETVSYQMALKYSLEEEQRRRQRYFTIHEIKTKQNKEQKIRGLLPLYDRNVIFHRRSDTAFEEELLQFPRGRRDDRIDAMAMSLEAMHNTRSAPESRQFKPHWKGYGARKK